VFGFASLNNVKKIIISAQSFFKNLHRDIIDVDSENIKQPNDRRTFQSQINPLYDPESTLYEPQVKAEVHSKHS
jgi:hypothetical protein